MTTTTRATPSPVPPADPRSLLDVARRTRHLEALAAGAVVDVLVVGGGITGAGVALDAASRGLSVALVEQGDLAAGTSRWSSKLVHGGMRYLASGQIGIAAESTRERGLLATTIAPHLVRSLPFVTPLGTAGVGRAMGVAVSSAQGVADVLRRTSGTPAAVFPTPRRVEVAEAVRLVPAVHRAGLRAALMSWDGQLEDDARLVVAVARTGAAFGARVLTRCAAVDVGDGGATVVDQVGGAVVDVRARHVVNATGVWADRLEPSVRLRPSRGTHLVLPAAALGNPTGALTVPVPGHFGRLLFALPQPDGLVYLGLTDEASDEVTSIPQPSQAEVDFLLETFSAGLERPLDRADLLGAFAGLRPLLAPADVGAEQPGGPATADLSRRHAVVERGGVVTVVGGKLTTYRAMAQEVVDRLTDAACLTARLPLVGAGPLDRHAAAAVPARLVRRFGAEAPAVAALAAGDPRLLAPLAPGVPALGVEVLWAVFAEGALDPADVLDGRLRLDLVPAWRAAAHDAVRDLLSEATPVG
jgi:glycerol-3-phosphate dehydrogenase